MLLCELDVMEYAVTMEESAEDFATKSTLTTSTSAGSTHIWVVMTSTVSRGLFICADPNRTYVRPVRALARATL